ncbi:MAG TPA: alpha/beta hydrolase-fold protein [Pseudonocardiaceae bacterium]|nr:alpha/beta hydrolase-fold protein [Pseudonocardiaceae bacterium]
MSVGPGPTLPPDVVARTLTPGVFEAPVIWQGLLLVAAVTAYVLFKPMSKRRREKIRPPMQLSSKLVIIGVIASLAGVFWVNNYVGYVRTGHDLAIVLQRSSGFTEEAGDGLAAATAPQDNYIANAAAALASAKHAGQATTQGNDKNPRVVQVPIADPSRGVPVGRANVMLPPGYDNPANAGKHYPVVYLLHGYPDGTADDWFTSGDALNAMQALLDDHVVQPMIIVAPDMTAEQPSIDWECLNIPGGPQLEDYLVKTVVPAIDNQFRTIPDRTHRAIGGMSGGGYCTLNIGLQHLETFGSLLISLPYDDLGDSAGVLNGHPDLVKANTPRLYIPTMNFTQPVSVIIAAGEGAPTDVATSHRLANALAARGQKVALVLQPGLDHTWREARAALPYLLDFANQVFSVPPTGALPAAPPPGTNPPGLVAQQPQFQLVPHPPAHGGSNPGSTHTGPHKGTTDHHLMNAGRG